MECVNCDCTVKTMDGLEGSIQALLQRGKRVNRMMNNEKLIREVKRMEEIEQLKKQIPKSPLPTQPSITMDSTMKESAAEPKKRRIIFNRDLKAAESIDFDIPSLMTETSENGTDDNSSRFTTATLSIPTKTGRSSSQYTKSETTTVTSEFLQSTFKKSSSSLNKNNGGGLIINHHYTVDKDGSLKTLPMKVHIKQRHEDGTLDVQFEFFDEKSEKVMNISMKVHSKNIHSVQFCGNIAKLDQSDVYCAVE